MACLESAGNAAARIRELVAALTLDEKSRLVDERTLREVYLRAFEIAIVKGEPWKLMAAHNHLNGTYCTENRRLLHDPGEWTGWRETAA